jgi:hypothetical protein
MKTNVVMKSGVDRDLFGHIIRQETKTGFLNISDLQDAYTIARYDNGWVKKRVDHILSRIENTERIYYVLHEQGLVHVQFHTFIKQVELNGITNVLKQYNVYKTTGARTTKTSWCNPYIWLLIAMEMSPLFYAKTVIWLTDKLIINRIEAGNFCVALNTSIQKFNLDGYKYAILAKTLNQIVFGRHETGIRNTGSKEQLKKLYSIEEKMAFAIDMGYIDSFEMLLKEIQKLGPLKRLKR